MKILLYAPMKHPDHPSPSGDRTIGREVRAMLLALGHEVEVVSRLSSLTMEPAARSLEDALALAQVKALTLTARYRRAAVRPDLWISFHLFAKSPDLLGPLVAQALDIPYVTISASVSSSDRSSAFRAGLALARTAIRRCDAVFWNKPKDKKAIARLAKCPLEYLPPSVDPERFAAARPLDLRAGGAGPVIATLSLWRPGRKVDSLVFLARALTILHERAPGAPWLAVVAGDATAPDPVVASKARADVRAAFAGLPAARGRFHGLVAPGEVPAFLKGADAFAFPGLREPLGMVFLEAQAAGLPVVAVGNSGIATMVSKDGAILVDAPEPEDYADALAALLADRERRARMGEAALRFVAAERSQAAARAHLAEGLAMAIEHHRRRRRR